MHEWCEPPPGTESDTSRRINGLLVCLSLLCLLVAFTWEGRTYEGTVASVPGGDEIKIRVDNREIRVRLAEIDAPEKGQPWARRARRALAAKVSKQTVNVDVIGVKRDGWVIGKVWLDDTYVNRELVLEGHVWAYRKYAQGDDILEDEAVARSANRGLWSLPEEERSPPWRRRASTD